MGLKYLFRVKDQEVDNYLKAVTYFMRCVFGYACMSLRILQCNYYETLPHPSSCVVIMVWCMQLKIVKTLDAPITEIWSLRPTLDLESDKSLCFNHKDELDSAVQFPKLGHGQHTI